VRTQTIRHRHQEPRMRRVQEQHPEQLCSG
jgi:hypothetical protein